MKKGLLFICLVFYSLFSKGQFGIIQNIGGPTTLVKTPNYGGFQSGIIPYTFTDTSSANAALTYGKTYNGFLIYTQTPQATWWRLADSSKWVMILPQGGGTPISGQAWINPGNSNLFTDASLNGGFGTLGNNGVYFKTNGITRLYLDRNGIAPETGTTLGIGIDIADSNRITYFSGGGGSTPTWQQTLTAGSTLNTDNTIDGGQNELAFVNNNNIYIVGGSAILGGARTAYPSTTVSEIEVTPDIVFIKPYLGNLKIDTLTNAVGTKALRYNPTTGLVSYADTTAAGANTALSNLASVAINTSLLPGTDDGAALGSTSKEFSDLFLASGGVINWANGNTTLTQTSGALTLGGGFYATSSVAAGTYLYGGDKYNTYTGYTGAVLGGITTHAVLDFVDNNSRIGEFYTDASNFNFFTDVSKGIVFYVNNSFTAPALQFSSAGALRLGYLGAGALTADASGNITSVSDERLKNIEGGYGVGLSQVYKINPIVYKWKPETKLDSLNSYIGFSAQNIEYALGENAVGINRDGYKSIQDRAILAALTNSIKELKDLNDSQQKEIDDLKKEVKKLKRL